MVFPPSKYTIKFATDTGVGEVMSKGVTKEVSGTNCEVKL